MDGSASGAIFQFEGFRFDRSAGSLRRENGSGVAVPLMLGSRATSLLALLVERQGELVTKDEIFATVWSGTAVEEANLTVQISAVHRILDQDRQRGSCIQTVPGRGYRFVVPVTRAAPSDLMDADPPFTNGRTEKSGIGQATQEVRAADRDRYSLRRFVVAAVAGVVCFVAAVAATLIWHSLSPWQTQPAPRLSIVVLPFVNLSDDREQQYFADGITEEITADLARIPHMFVISRGTALTYKDKPVGRKQIGRELGVRYVLEGSVRRADNRIQVDAQLVDADTNKNLRVKQLEGDATDLPASQNDITSRLSVALNFALVGVEAGAPLRHPDALDYLIRGRASYSKTAIARRLWGAD